MILTEELKIESLTIEDRGGQHVGYTSAPMRVTHLPTGISVTVEMRSQHRSRLLAVEMIECALTSPNFRP